MTKIHPSKRLTPLAPHFFASLGARVSAMQASGCDIVRLDEGAPDLPPAPHIIETLARSASLPGSHSYQPHRGTAALRAAWAAMLYRDFGVEVNPNTQILPLLGSKEGIFHLSMAWLDPGDVVLIPDPGYITYTRGALFAGAEPVYLPLLPERGYLPDLDSIPHDTARRARLLWLNYPNNPTSATASLEFFAEAVAFAQKWDLLVCHDAAYTHVTYDGYTAPSLLQARDASQVGLEFLTLSKTYNMAGWRTAAVAGSAEAIKALFTLKTNQDSGHFLPVMEAAAAALTGDQGWIRQRNLVYQERRDIVMGALLKMGLEARPPIASLYVWCPVPSFGRIQPSSVAFCQAVLEEAYVSLTPGTVFGAGGEGYVRLSLTAPAERIALAMQRWETWQVARVTEPINEMHSEAQ